MTLREKAQRLRALRAEAPAGPWWWESRNTTRYLIASDGGIYITDHEWNHHKQPVWDLIEACGTDLGAILEDYLKLSDVCTATLDGLQCQYRRGHHLAHAAEQADGSIAVWSD